MKYSERKANEARKRAKDMPRLGTGETGKARLSMRALPELVPRVPGVTRCLTFDLRVMLHCERRQEGGSTHTMSNIYEESDVETKKKIFFRARFHYWTAVWVCRIQMFGV